MIPEAPRTVEEQLDYVSAYLREALEQHIGSVNWNPAGKVKLETVMAGCIKDMKDRQTGVLTNAGAVVYYDDANFFETT